ncbi:MAG: MarR family winged helix-turn-helix transcriptional regulator [Thermoplasmataceae archaeon]
MVKLRQNFPSKYKKPEDSPGFLLWQVTNSWQRLMRRVLKEIGLTHVQFVLLTAVEWLNNAKIPATQKEVSRFANTDVMMTSQVIRALERKGLIIRAEHPTDTRAYLLQVTSQGHQLDLKALELVEFADENFFKALRSDLAHFVQMLKTLKGSR